ncbi:hypothetical protein [Iamia sp. SCSIO 61187]|uniref:hypothetical protein n=1 Tax=Iamia sp. SCSIO 61187 TaxID=2722752 RepID=UPI001C62C263|nr:hypothetical protein [Iamia sp. SCSIO 61187]
MGLGLLTAPRVVLHDLGVDVGPLNLVLVFGPPSVWVWYAHRQRVARPVLALAGVGLVYGVILAVLHMVLWDESFGDDPPGLEGNVAQGAEEGFLRVSTVVSSLVVGTVFGALAGLVALVLARRRRSASA